MEARFFKAALLAATLLASMGASHRTRNFVVHTADPQHAAAFCQAAENYRRELAVSWLGKALPDWSQPCPITVQVGPQLGAGGATTFVFDRGEVFGWRMSIQGSYERVLDSVLPHEITHMIFATHFRRPLPRWADEGGATTVEHESEKAKHRTMLCQFLRSNRGIAFNQMFAMTEYPRDIMPLYAQGYSLAEFLIRQGGRRKYINFVADGLDDNHWSAALKKHYGIQDLGTLQNTWLAWVRDGFPALPARPAPPETSPATLLASASAAPKRERPAPDPVPQGGDNVRLAAGAETPSVYGPVPAATAPQTDRAVAQATAAQPFRPGSTARPGAVWTRPMAPIPLAWERSQESPAPSEPIYSQVTRPQSPEKSRQIVLEWQRTARR